ncbi:MAG: hypothetical protein LN414_08530 [Candidatus Thermoplasmatota archaeon]|nr:hypothetical protein [Candidatus Thermoplasmatota archaeon]
MYSYDTANIWGASSGTGSGNAMGAFLLAFMAATALFIITVSLLGNNWYVYVEDSISTTEWSSEETYGFGPIEGVYVDRESWLGEPEEQDITRIRYDSDLLLPVEGKFVVVARLTTALMWLGITLMAALLVFTTLLAMEPPVRLERSLRDLAGIFGQLAFWSVLTGVLLFGILFPYTFLKEIDEAGNAYQSASLGWSYVVVLLGCLSLWVAAVISSRAAGIRFAPFDGVLPGHSTDKRRDEVLAGA